MMFDDRIGQFPATSLSVCRDRERMGGWVGALCLSFVRV